jgi:hypothetical protein
MPIHQPPSEFHFLVQHLDKQALIDLAVEFGVTIPNMQDMLEEELQHALLMYAGVAEPVDGYTT